MMKLTDGVKNVLIIIALFYLLGMVLGQTNILPFTVEDLVLFFPTSDFFKPHQLITHMFLHLNFNHLFFNALMLVFLGPMTESILGTKDFIKMYLLSGVGAFLAHYALIYFAYPPESQNIASMLGASGCLFGIYGVLLSKVPNAQLMLIIPPMPVKIKYLVPLLIAYDLYQGFSGAGTGVAHFAHVGGAVVGFIYAHFFHRTSFR